MALASGDRLVPPKGGFPWKEPRSHIDHPFDTETCQTLTHKAASALKPGGKLVIHEFLTDGDNPAARRFALTMVAWTKKGEAYSSEAYGTFCKAAGLPREGVHPIEGMPMGLVVARKPRQAMSSEASGLRGTVDVMKGATESASLPSDLGKPPSPRANPQNAPWDHGAAAPRRGISRNMVALGLLFMASGAIGLGCETVYFRWLALSFGVAHETAGALLAVFMGGMALGAKVGERRIHRVQSPLGAYALCEAVVGISTLVLPETQKALLPLTGSSQGLGAFALSFLLLALPTFAMGATYPFMVAAASRTGNEDDGRGNPGKALGPLYACNVAGGVLGASLTGFGLLPRAGTALSTRILGALGLTLALMALAVRSKWPDFAPSPSSEPSATRAQGTAPTAEALPPASPVALALALLVGTLSFALQVVDNRVLSLLLGSSAYTFSLVVVLLLFATALGGARGLGSTTSEADVYRAVAQVLLRISVLTFLAAILVQVAPFYLALAARSGHHPGAVRALLALLIVAPSAYAVGSLFPVLALRLPRKPSDSPGALAGRASFVTTAANIAGALAGSFVLLPRLGARLSLLSLSVGTLLGALLAAYKSGERAFRGMVFAAGTALAVGVALSPSWDPVSLSAGTYRTALYRKPNEALSKTGCGPERDLPKTTVLYHGEGALGTVVVLGHDDPSGRDPCALYSLRVNGKTEGSAFVRAPLARRIAPASPLLPTGDLPSEVLAGTLPRWLAPHAQRAFLVGWGTGISGRALLETGITELHAAELEPAVLSAARVFDESLLADERVHIVVDDARRVLERNTTEAYDVLVSHPSNPWVTGASALFSREYFTLVRQRMNPRGLAIAWVQLYEIDREAVRSLAATFLDVFPRTHVFRPSPQSRDLFFVGFRDPMPSQGDADSDRASVAPFFAIPPTEGIRAMATLAGLGVEKDRVQAYLGGPARLRRYVEGAPIETDTGPYPLELRVASKLLAGDEDSPDTLLEGLVETSTTSSMK